MQSTSVHPSLVSAVGMVAAAKIVLVSAVIAAASFLSYFGLTRRFPRLASEAATALLLVLGFGIVCAVIAIGVRSRAPGEILASIGGGWLLVQGIVLLEIVLGWWDPRADVLGVLLGGWFLELTALAALYPNQGVREGLLAHLGVFGIGLAAWLTAVFALMSTPFAAANGVLAAACMTAGVLALPGCAASRSKAKPAARDGERFSAPANPRPTPSPRGRLGGGIRPIRLWPKQVAETRL